MSKNKRSLYTLAAAAAPAAAAAKPATLSLCMIVKNEAANLGPCLESVKPAVDEIIVVDTGSTDATKDIAARYQARIFDVPWRGDFSAARNASIERATGDYILWLDADDRIDPGELEKILALKSQLPAGKDTVYYLTIRNKFINDSDIYFAQLRIFPNIPRARFEYRIHEQIFRNSEQDGVAVKRIDITINHTGYHDAGIVGQKSLRNLAIIEDELKQDPDNPFMHLQAARTLAGMNRQAEAIPHMQRVMAVPHLLQDQRRVYFTAGMLLGRYHNELAEYDRAETVFKSLSRDFPEEHLIHYFLGESLMGQDKHQDAVRELTASLSQPLCAGLFPLNIDMMCFQQHYFLGMAYAALGQPAEARHMFQKSLGLYRDDYKSYMELGSLNLREARWAEAEEALRQGIAKAGGFATAGNYANWGLALSKLARTEEAKDAWVRALELDPRLREGLCPLGYLRLEQGRIEEARDLFLRAQAEDDSLTDVALALSRIAWKSRDVNAVLKQAGRLLNQLKISADKTMDGLEDLAALYNTFGDRLVEQQRGEVALMAYHVSFLIYPLADVFKKITAFSQGRLSEKSVAVVRESVEAHAQDPAAIAALQTMLSATAALP